jgi:hypothetical protein
VFNFHPEIDNYIIGVIVENDSFIWAYYDCTDCADYFLSKVNSKKDSSFQAYFESKGISIKCLFPSFDGRTTERCVLCSCANGHRLNFKIYKNDYSKVLALFKGTKNRSLFNRYR